MSKQSEKLINKPHPSAAIAKPTNSDSQYITRERIEQFLPKGSKKAISDELLTLIANAETDTGVPQEVIEDDFLGYIHLATSSANGRGVSFPDLLNAVKYCNLKRNYTNMKAWSIVFPKKFKELSDNNKPIDNFVSAYNGAKIVQAIDKEMLIPIHLQYAPYFHAAVKKQFTLMNGSTGEVDSNQKPIKVSPMVQHLAAKELANLTRQPEETKIDMRITPSDAALSAQGEMNDQLKQIVAMQRKQLEDGGEITDVQVLGIGFNEINSNE